MTELSKHLALAVTLYALLAAVYAVASGRATRGNTNFSDSDGGGDASDGGGGD